MYPESMAAMQLEEVLHRLRIDLPGFLILPSTTTLPDGAEHFRAAAIAYWLKQERTSEQTEKLCRLIALDPDAPMARAFMRELGCNRGEETPPKEGDPGIHLEEIEHE